MPHNSKFLDYEPVVRSKTKDRQPLAEVDAREVEPPPKNGKHEISEPLSLNKPSATQTGAKWILRRGHTISYAGLFLFTVVLFIRPYEQISALSSLTSMAFWVGLVTLFVFVLSQLTIEGTLTVRTHEVNLVLLLCLTGLLSIPTAINRGEAWTTFTDSFLKAILMFIVMVNVVRTERRLKGLLFLTLGVTLVLSVIALNDYRLGNLAVRDVRIQGAIGNLFDNPNDLALHLATIVPIAVAFFFIANNPFLKILYALAAALMAAAIVVTFSRGGFLGLVVAGTCLAWKLGRRNRVVTFALIVLIVGIFIIFSPAGYSDRVASIFSHNLDPYGSASTRRELFYISLWTALRHPIFGIGMGNFHIISIQELVSHNAYTQVAAEMGLAAAVVYVMFIISPLRRLHNIEGDSLTAPGRKRFYYLAVGLQASLIGYMVASFFASVAYQWYIYYLVAYAVSFRRIYEDRKPVESSESRQSRYESS